MYNQLELREIFHLGFLGWLGRKIKSKHYSLKGGANLRFFFKSLRYSEDIDLDAHGIRKEALTDTVMQILSAPSLLNALRPFGIQRIVPPDISKAKQTEVTQRFKAHLINTAGEDLFTKIEFSRRGFKGDIAVEPVSEEITRRYKLPPVLVPHYDIHSAVCQKIDALSARVAVQARDIFDLYILSTQYAGRKGLSLGMARSKLKKAHERIFDIGFIEFRDNVVSYLSPEDQNIYGESGVWDEVKLKTAGFLEELGKKRD